MQGYAKHEQYPDWGHTEQGYAKLANHSEWGAQTLDLLDNRNKIMPIANDQ